MRRVRRGAHAVQLLWRGRNLIGVGFVEAYPWVAPDAGAFAERLVDGLILMTTSGWHFDLYEHISVAIMIRMSHSGGHFGAPGG